jgi:two-component system CheB/CheR fusion protein
MDQPNPDQLFVVGIGASAGGLRALEDFFDHVPDDSGAAFVVVQHLSSDFKSLMKELLERHTTMGVHRAQEGLALQPNNIYLIPPRQTLVVREGQLHLLAPPDLPRGQPNFSINLFFESLAKAYGEKAVGIVLSGTGSDGSFGLEAISEGGGVALVQSPETAEFDGMPQSALATGIIDQALAPRDLARFTYDFVQRGGQGYPLVSDEFMGELDKIRLQQILSVLEEKEHLDFSYYKISTLTRRCFRRCSMAGYDNIDQYIEYLKLSVEEQHLLKADLLINVTRFFRDPLAWNVLEIEVLPNLISQITESNSVFRAWVAACSTGEEAYSMAMLIDSVMETIGKRFPIKIFATDVDTYALQKASDGIYPETIATDVPSHLLDKYFHWQNGHFHVKSNVRESIIFAPHNLTKNAGFAQMNLVSCRNVLIYMRPQQQQRVLHTFHFSLAAKGVLFLGESETTGSLAEEFIPLNEKWKVFQKRRDIRLPLLNPAFEGRFSPRFYDGFASQRQPAQSEKSAINPMLERALAEVYAHRHATCVLLDSHDRVLHLVIDGADILRVPQGTMTNKINAMLPPELHVPVSTALNRARRNPGEAIIYTDIGVESAAEGGYLQITATYSEGQRHDDSFSTLVIEPSGTMPTVPHRGTTFLVSEDASQRMLELEYELQQTRENLQTTIEELETTNEEQQSTNEELLASNEELQSTNEELHSVNEELYTVNAEYQSKIAQLTELNNDMVNLLKSTDIGVVFLDADLRIRKFTPVAAQVINLVESDIGRPLDHITRNFDYANLSASLQHILNTGESQEQQIRLTTTGDHLLMRVHPYCDDRDRINGIVLTFVKINALKEVEDQLATALNLLETTYETTPVGLGIIDCNGCFVRINPALADINGLSVEEHIGHPIPEILPDLANDLIPLYQRILETGEAVTNLEITGKTPAAPGEIRHWVASYYPVPEGIGAVITEVTALKRAQQAIADNETRLNYLLSSSPAVIFTCAPADNYRCLSMSDNVREVLGYTPDDFIENPDFWLEHLHPADRDRVIAGLQAWDQHSSYNHEYRLRCADGTYRWVDARLKMSQDPSTPDQPICIGSLIDVTERKDAQNALLKNESLFQLTLDQSEIMVFTQDLNLAYQWVYNPIAGFTEADFLHKTDADIFPATDVQSLIETKQQVLRNQARQISQFCLHQAGGDRYFNLKLEPMTDLVGNPTGLAGVLYEVTEEKQVALALAYAKEQAQAANQVKSEFLATMSHELRTPLNAILGTTDTLQEGILGPISNRQARALTTIEQSSTHLLNLINDILDISKVEAGQLEPDWGMVSVADLCQHSLDLIAQQAQKKQITLQADYQPTDLPDLWGDARRLRQILVNLLDNAVKFTPAGGQVTLATRVADDQIHVSITDTGIGIAAEHTAALFQPFTQVESTLSRQYEGTGLGLALVKQLTELHGGQVSYTSTVGQGSCFTVVLPLRPPLGTLWPSPAPQADLPEPPVAAVDDCSDLILLAEDNETNIETSLNYLEAKGYRIIVARNGLEAVAMARTAKPALILMDVQMPELNGLDAIQHIRQDPDPAVNNVPIIALTAMAMVGDRERCLQAGADEYMSKPVSFKILTAKMQELLVIYRNRPVG